MKVPSERSLAYAKLYYRLHQGEEIDVKACMDKMCEHVTQLLTYFLNQKDMAVRQVFLKQDKAQKAIGQFCRQLLKMRFAYFAQTWLPELVRHSSDKVFHTCRFGHKMMLVCLTRFTLLVGWSPMPAASLFKLLLLKASMLFQTLLVSITSLDSSFPSLQAFHNDSRHSCRASFHLNHRIQYCKWNLRWRMPPSMIHWKSDLLIHPKAQVTPAA